MWAGVTTGKLERLADVKISSVADLNKYEAHSIWTNPPQYLKADNLVELGIDGLGGSRQEVVPWESFASHVH